MHKTRKGKALWLFPCNSPGTFYILPASGECTKQTPSKPDHEKNILFGNHLRLDSDQRCFWPTSTINHILRTVGVDARHDSDARRFSNV